MAADRPLTERGIIEIKMGRSKFPGKPSKIGNRKRVNLSSCALPEDNDSSKAAKNIYLGLSVFNETFGDNEMVAPKPFYGFSLEEVEEAMAEARLQQKEAEVEYKKQGISINLWDCFQNELFSIASCLGYGENSISKKDHIIDAKLSFDGGGNSEKKETKTLNSQKNDDNQASNIGCNKSIMLKNKTSKVTHNAVKRSLRTLRLRFPISKSQHSPKTNRSLQSQAAKKLLEKAKMSNLADSSKNLLSEKKFILPSRSIHSARVIKPNKKFLEENMSKRKLLRSSGASEPVLSKKPKVIGDLLNSKISSEKPVNKSLTEELKIDVSYEDGRRKKFENSENKTCLDSPQSNLTPNTGKGILREARLQLDKSSVSLLEGPFSSPNASSLSPNSHVKVNLTQSATASGSIVCGVCGIVRFVELATKFGIHCCESCRKFISKIIKSSESEQESKLQCLKNNGLCLLNPVVKNQHFNINRTKNHIKCQACWLKLCVKNFKMPIKLKQKLLKLLPVNMQMSINLESNPLLTNDITNKFLLGNNNVKDFKWLYENSNSQERLKDNNTEKQLNWLSAADSLTVCEKSLRKRTRNSGTENKSMFSTQNRKSKSETDEKNRQSVVLKGPRVKHVCRSASVVLGQPLATFPSETSPTKKLTNADDCKNCDNLLTTNNSVESQGNKFKSNKELCEVKQGNKDKKPNSGKENSNPKPNLLQQNIANSKPKKKAAVKTENPISMDFWESYDPEEVCETGFGLIGSEIFTVRALCFLCGSLGHEKLIHCASCCEPYHEFCVDEGQLKLGNDIWKYNWVCPRCTVCFTCGRTSGQQLKCVKCDNSYHIECVDRVGGRLLHSPDRPWVCSACLRCKSCNAVDVSIFVGNLPLCKACFILRQKGNYCPLCQRCYEDDDYDSKMMECGQCKCWVHAKCEGLSDEKYQVLSFLPESVEYVCRMCCIMPPAPWWLAVEAELKSGYLGVLKALSKNRKACTMLKWSPRKQCSCRQLNFVSKALDFDDKKISKNANEYGRNEAENLNPSSRDKKVSSKDAECKGKQEKGVPAAVTERKTSIEVISHPTESLKLTLKILKNTEAEDKEENVKEKNNVKENSMRVKKCPSNEENSEDSLTNLFDCQEDSQTSVLSLFKSRISSTEFQEKRSLSSPVIPSSDSGIGSTDDELKASCLTDEESSKLDEQCSNSNRTVETKLNCDNTVSFLEEKHECFCFLEVDSYNSRSKPFSPNLMAIKKKVTTSEYSSLHQFHQDMQRMIATTNSDDLMDLYHQTVKEIFPWFDPKYSRVQSNSQKVSEALSLESTPVKSSPSKNYFQEECKIPKEKLSGQPLDYFYKDYMVDDTRYCLLCKTIGDGPPGDTGRLLYCGQNEWVHCNCALWSGEVFEEIDGSLQNVHSAINRGRSIKCPECNLKGASIGCCARNCQETYHFSCARKVGCIFMDDKTLYCPLHVKESIGKLVQNEKDFEIRRPVYVELDKRKMKSADSSQIHFAVGALQVENIGKFVMKLSDQQEAIIPEQFSCTRLFWSCYEPWRIVRYHFTVRLVEVQEEEGVDFGINLTVDHSKDPELVELKLKQLRYFQDHNLLLDISEEILKEKRKLLEHKSQEGIGKLKPEENIKVISAKRIKRDNKSKKLCDHFDLKFEENCLSDSQSTADLLPPDLEEAIFNDLPHDILDGISMQDIFMDIKNDPYENNQKEGVVEESSETEDTSNSSPNKTRKNESVTSSQNEFWAEPNDTRQDSTEEIFTLSKNTKEAKINRTEGLINQVIKKANTLKTYQKSCSVNWNCKGEANKWKKNSKCHVTVNLLDSQERGNMLQELKFTDGLVTISTGAIDSVQDLKAHLDENKCSIQQQEGKENKCLQWHARLQPRLLQVDGNVDSSSSGSEAGESPQRLMDENINPKIVPPHKISPFLDSPKYSLSSPEYKATSYLPTTSNLSPAYSPGNSVFGNSSSLSLPQLDGLGEDSHSDNTDLEEEFVSVNRLHDTPKHNNLSEISKRFSNLTFRINQCDGSVDSDLDDEDSLRLDVINDREMSQTNEEPVKCSKCYCTYRTKMSYQRHLETCSNDFILSSSEGELSEEESPKKQCNNNFSSTKNDNSIMATSRETVRDCNSSKENLGVLPLDKRYISNSLSLETHQSPERKVVEIKKERDFVEVKKEKEVLEIKREKEIIEIKKEREILEVKKEKAVKRTYTRRKSLPNAKKPTAANPPQAPQIGAPATFHSNNTPAVVVQDVQPQNVVPTAFIGSTPTLGFLSPIDSQNPYTKTQLIATPNGIISGNIQFPPAPQTQVIGGLCLNPQNINPNLSGFIIQQPQAPGTLISQPGPLMMSSEQVVVGSTGLYDVIQDPRTGGMFLTNHNQPIFYNTETIVSNTVMQTNQFVSNFLATTYSQTSTQIFQTSEIEPVVGVPSGYIIVGPNPSTTNRILSPEDLICVQTPQTVIPNQTSIQIPNQNLFNPPIQSTQTFTTDPKLMPTQINPIRCLQPIRVKPVFPSVVLNKVTSSTNTQIAASPMAQRARQPVPTPVVTQQNQQTKIKQTSKEKTSIPNHPRGVPMMRPDVPIASKTRFEKAVITPKSTVQQVQPRSRALVDYINNFRSDICDSVQESAMPSSCELNKSVDNSLAEPLEKQRTTSNNRIEPVKSATKSKASSTITNLSSSTCYSEKQSEAPVLSIKIESRNTSPKVTSPTELARAVAKPTTLETTTTRPKEVTTTIAKPTESTTTKATAAELATTSVSSAPVLLPEISAKPLVEVVNKENDISRENTVTANSASQSKSVNSVTSPVNSVSNMSERNDLENCGQVKRVEANSLLQEKNEKTNKASLSTPLKVSVNKANLLTCEPPTQSSLSMPELDSPPCRHEERNKILVAHPPTPKEDEKLPGEVLPLQENSQSINITKSPQKSSPVKNCSENSVVDLFDDKIKPKKKICFDQNSPDYRVLQTQDQTEKRKLALAKKFEDKGPKLIFDVTSDDGFKNSSSSMLELWANICDSVQEMRAVLKIPPLPVSRKGHEILGMQNHGLQYCLEQLRGVEQCINYKCKYFVKEEEQKTEEDEVEVVKENLSGCARTEEFSGRKEYDMFAWLASRHRQLPKLTESAEEILSSIRRANNLPMAMKYRNLRETAKLYVAVYRSKIHGRGLFCLREIEAGEMVIEYAGEVIRSTLTDKREKYYTDKGIGCYMFRIDDHFVVDATMKGNAARFINHSCEPNCYSRVVDILGKKHIVIFALRRINIMEELTYDYKFPLEDEKISCHCLSKKCRKYLN